MIERENHESYKGKEINKNKEGERGRKQRVDTYIRKRIMDNWKRKEINKNKELERVRKKKEKLKVYTYMRERESHITGKEKRLIKIRNTKEKRKNRG